MKVILSLDKKLRTNLLILFVAGLLFWSSMASLLATLPLYVKYIGASKQEIGIVMGSFAIGLLSFRSLLGRLADKRGRKIVLLIGTGVVSIAPLLYLGVSSVPLLMAVRAFHGISIAAFSTAYAALVADLAPVENRGEVIGYMSLVTSLGVAIGPAVGSYIQEGFGYSPLFIVSSGLGFASMLCTAKIVNPPLDSHTEIKALKEKFWRSLVSPRVRTLAVILLLIGLTFGTMRNFIPLFIKETEINLSPGLFYTASAIASFNVRLLVGRAGDRYGRGLFVTISLVFYTIAMFSIWSAHNPQTFLIAGAIEGAGLGTLIPMMSAIIADRASGKDRGKMFSLCMTGFDLGIAIAGPVVGTIAEEIGYRNIFACAASLAFLAIIIFLTFSSKDLSHSLQFALGRIGDTYALNKKELSIRES
ncbi:MAG: MFS transporter [Cyanobacteria bacterium P01_A01_bin.84]